MKALSSATTDCIGPRQAGARLGFFEILSRRATSEKAGDGGGASCPDPDFQQRASDVPGNGELPPSPSTSANVAGRSRRLTGSETTRPAGEPPGGRTTRGTCSSWLYRLRP